MLSMVKNILSILCCFFIVGTQLGVQALEIHDLKPQCCCETQCECDHAPTTNTTIRNVRCGDNSDDQALGKQLDPHELIQHRQLSKIDHRIKPHSLNSIQSTTITNDPPPPKPILS